MSQSSPPPEGAPGTGDSPRPPINPAGAAASPPPPPGFYYPPPGYAPPPPSARGGIFTRIAVGLVTSILLLSLLANFYFGAFFVSSVMQSGVNEQVYDEGDRDHRVVILPAKGFVGQEMEDFLRDALKALDENKPKAIVFRVDSPGGDPFASDRIVHLLRTFKKNNPDIPIVSSYGTVAASGGYYISAGTDYIFAEPLCRTGSIGVMSSVFTFAGLLEKVGVTPEIQTATGSPRKDVANNIFRDFGPEDRAVMQETLDELHTRFVEVVHEGRSAHLDLEQARALANGEVYSAAKAKELQLIDAIGFLDEAIAYAAQQGGVPAGVEPHVTIIEPRVRLSLLNLVTGTRQPEPAVSAEQLRHWLIDLQTPRAEFRYLP